MWTSWSNLGFNHFPYFVVNQVDSILHIFVVLSSLTILSQYLHDGLCIISMIQAKSRRLKVLRLFIKLEIFIGSSADSAQ